jgi:hypothetical protein
MAQQRRLIAGDAVGSPEPISHHADHYPSREGSGHHLRHSTTDRMRIDPRNSLPESVPSVPQEFEVRATKIYPSRYCHNHSKKSDVVSYVIDGHHFLAPNLHDAQSKFSATSRLYIERSNLLQVAACSSIDAEQRHLALVDLTTVKE